MADGVARDGGVVAVQSARQLDVVDGIVDVSTLVNGVVTADDEVTVVIAGAVVTSVGIDAIADAVLNGVDVDAEQKPRTA